MSLQIGDRVYYIRSAQMLFGSNRLPRLGTVIAISPEKMAKNNIRVEWDSYEGFKSEKLWMQKSRLAIDNTSLIKGWILNE